MRLTERAAARPAAGVKLPVPSIDGRFNGVKVFSATMYADRERLGEAITAWLAARPDLKVTQMVVTQSSDAAFHCIAITVFYWELLGALGDR